MKLDDNYSIEREMKEIWKDVVGYEGLYQVSNLGRVKSLDRAKFNYKKGDYVNHEGRILSETAKVGRYISVAFYLNGMRKTKFIHQLVAQAFLNHKPDGLKLVVNHINLNIKDNRLENLEIVTNRENSNKKHIKSSSKYVGVSWHKTRRKWQSSISYKGKTHYLGLFKTEKVARAQYLWVLENLNTLT